MPVFDSEFRFIKSEGGLFGFWYNLAKKNYQIPFSATTLNSDYKNRFSVPKKEINAEYNGEWETVFSEGTDDQYKAIGVFKQTNQNVEGTFINLST